ncbi:TM2 domain-containing protein [Tomitella biformata]|uniref:TM2 domain-containing protein n=1 Tax=Tomitella biformata TaxID=630403 RepID=UPI0004634CD5|nr:TM2 domain-containing protein [Tomitella biformata]
MSNPDLWQEDPSQSGFNQPSYPGQAPLFPQGQYPPASYPPVGYTQPSYPQTGPAYAQQFAPPAMSAPYGFHPVTGQPLSDKSKVAAGLLSIFLGYFGVGRFYAGNTGLGVAQLLANILLTIITLGFWLSVAWIWPLIDGIVLLTGNPRDGMGRLLR